MQSGKPNAKNVESGRQILPDMLVWSWLLIFSTRAIRALTAAGCAGGEFWPCRFDTNPDDEFFFFLPEKHYDIIDFEKSKFRIVLPLDPPVPILIESLVALPLVEELPPCFHAEYPGRDIAFPDMFVRDDFKRKWEENGFTGARFVEI